VFAGKAHPRDEPGKNVLRQIVAFADRHRLPRSRFVFLEDYDLDLARALVAGADVWLNLPIKPYEASGTSGMKAAANGALNLSVPDGWWAEAVVEHNRLAAPVGWIVDPAVADGENRDRVEAGEVFRLLETEVVPLFHDRDADGIPVAWLDRIRSQLRQLPPFFNTHRMVRQYLHESYLQAGASVERQQAGGQAG
jgi:glycogen phosphorylase